MDDTTAANRGAHDNIISHGTLSTGSYIHTHWHEIVHNLDLLTHTELYKFSPFTFLTWQNVPSFPTQLLFTYGRDWERGYHSTTLQCQYSPRTQCMKQMSSTPLLSPYYAQSLLSPAILFIQGYLSRQAHLSTHKHLHLQNAAMSHRSALAWAQIHVHHSPDIIDNGDWISFLQILTCRPESKLPLSNQVDGDWNLSLPNDDTLVLILNQHVPVHVVSKSPNMRRVFIGGLQFVCVCVLQGEVLGKSKLQINILEGQY